MLRLLVYISIIGAYSGCLLVDNTVNGQYGSTPSTPVAGPIGPDPIGPEPTGLKLNINGCSDAPPEALPYSCSLVPETLYAQNSGSAVSNIARLNLDSVVSFELTQNTCTGLSLNSQGYLEGELAKTVAETCSLSIKGSMAGFTVEETLNLTVAPSLSFSFDNENIYVQEGQGDVAVDLVLSEPAPYDTFVEFDIYGDSAQVLSGISFITKKIIILEGQSRVTLSLSVSPTSGINQVVYQQLRLKSGSVNLLPGVSINSYDSTVTPRSFEKIAAGVTNTCGIDEGNLYCWGKDFYGQVGNGSSSSTDVVTPQQIGNSNLWLDVAVGEEHTCGIDDGKLFCWGRDNYGQLGNDSSSSIDIEEPLQIGTSILWQSLALGDYHTCGIDDGKLYCWGSDENGQVGNDSSTNTDVEAPVQIGSSILWQSLALGDEHTCGINAGMLFCWGKDLYGQVGNGSGSGADVDTPAQIGSSILWDSVATGDRYTCGIDDGKLFCWGFNYYGQVGNGNSGIANVYAPLQIGISNLWQYIALGQQHSCGIDDGRLFCWGRDNYGELGNGSDSKDDVYTPQQIGTSNLWESLALGTSHSCGLDDAKLYCWGRDNYGQVGNSSGSNSSVETPQRIGTSNAWQDVALGYRHSCGIENGKLFCWGLGALGNGSTSSSSAGTPLQIGTSNLWQSLALGQSHTCGINDSKLFCWGTDFDGQVGNGSTSNSSVYAPEQIGTSSLWQSYALGFNHTCGIDGGKLFCWGYNVYGQVGNNSGSSADVTAPQQIGTSSLWQNIALGDFHSCGIKEGKLFCWGRDTFGQVGNSNASTASVEAPEQIGTSNLWQSLALGAFHSCGINDGKLFCWGKDYYGMLGNGIGTAVHDPQQIGSSTLWQTITLGYHHTCGINDGELFCWGRDDYGQAGNGNGGSADVETPQKIGVSSSWQRLSSGQDHNCGIDDGKLFCWGKDTDGQVGKSTSILDAPFLIIE